MKVKPWICCLLLCLGGADLVGQAVVSGKIIDARTRTALPFVNVLLEGTQQGATTNEEGEFRIAGIQPGLYNLQVSSLGYESQTVFEILVGTTKVPFIQVELVSTDTELDVVEIRSKRIDRTTETPLSLRSISESEIIRNPGGNRDISKVIQALPGVASTVSFRNDIIIRGGSPNENSFYLDGIEVPVINHFATQGASGGPVGTINVNFIDGVDVLSGAFPAPRGNALSSVFEFRQKEGNREKMNYSFVVGSSDIGLTVDGPTGERSSLIVSARRSYLQFLFNLIGLPFLPTYNDVQFKETIRFKNEDKLTILGLAAYDVFVLNLDANEGVTDTSVIETNNFLIGNLPEQVQWNYTVGAKYEHFRENSLHRFILSRSQLDNSADKFLDNDDSSESNRLLGFNSGETENKLRYEGKWYLNDWSLIGGLGIEHTLYTTETFSQRSILGVPATFEFDSRLSFLQYAPFAQLSRTGKKLSLSLGIRTDATSIGNGGALNDPLEQFSPRLSASYGVNDAIAINFNIGRYFQLPPFTTLGFRENSSALTNVDNGIRHIQADHIVLGVEYGTKRNAKFSVEGFFKSYDHYPLLTDNGVSLANLGGDFGVVGNEPATPESEGRAFGVELLAQQKLLKDFYGILAYTFVKSEFTNADGAFTPSSWDFGHILNLTAGKRLKKNWEVGVKFRLQGGGPFTPFDLPTSSLIPVWTANQMGVLDFSRINTLRTGTFHQMDLRVDKRYYFDKWSLNVFLDVQNVYASDAPTPPFLNVETDESGTPIVDPNDPTRFLTRLVPDQNGNVLPSIGLIIEF